MWEYAEDPGVDMPDDEFDDRWAYAGHNPDDGMPVWRPLRGLLDDNDRSD